jgi:predicted DNA-binding protein
MKAMAHRTTFALDGGTIARLRRLAGRWHVSQAEVVRRAIEIADDAAADSTAPADALRKLHASGKLITQERAEAYLAEVNDARRVWRSEE